MLVIKRFSKRKKVFRERKKTGKIRAKRMVVKEIEDGLLEEMEVSHFGKEVMIFEWMSCASILLTDIFGFLEKFGWWFEQDIDGKSEDDNEKKLVMVNEEGWMS
ncbi:hypothetical protein Tco_0421102 [Tanacetum coccineum]